jgi:hypothetical protein
MSTNQVAGYQQSPVLDNSQLISGAECFLPENLNGYSIKVTETDELVIDAICLLNLFETTKGKNKVEYNLHDDKIAIDTISRVSQLLIDFTINNVAKESNLNILLFKDCDVNCRMNQLNSSLDLSRISSANEFSLLVVKYLLIIYQLEFIDFDCIDSSFFIKLLSTVFANEEAQSINSKFLKIIFGSTSPSLKQIELAFASNDNSFNLLHNMFNSLFFVLEKHEMYSNNAAIFERKELAKKTHTNTFKGGCAYIILMKQLEQVDLPFPLDINDLIMAFSLLFAVPQIQPLNHSFSKTLRSVYFNPKFKNTVLEIIVLFISRNLRG